MLKQIVFSARVITCILCCAGLYTIALSFRLLPFQRLLLFSTTALCGYLFFKIIYNKQGTHSRRSREEYEPASTAIKPFQLFKKTITKTFNKEKPAVQGTNGSNLTMHDLLGRGSICLSNSKMADLIRNKTILITGAAGSIGSGIAKQVAALQPAALIVCDHSETALYELEYELEQEFQLGYTLKPVLANVTSRAAMTQVFINWKPDIIFHAAAYKHVPMMELHPCEAIHNNVYGTKVVADLACLFEAESFILISTDKAVSPSSVMGASKRIAEMYCSALAAKEESLEPNNLLTYLQDGKKTKFITTRFGNVLHSNGSVIPRFQQQIAAGGPVTVTHPEMSRYFMTLKEACTLVMEAATMGSGGEVFMFDMGKPVNILELAQKLIKNAGYRPEAIKIEFTGLRPGEKLHEELLDKTETILPTYHPKIMIAKAAQQRYTEMKANLIQLLKAADQQLSSEVIKQIKRMVPQYNGTAEDAPLVAGEAMIKTKVISY